MRCLLVMAVLLTTSSRVNAEDEDQAKADQLFEEAQRLKQAGKTSEACKKYDEALHFNRNAVGTLLNVGKCAEDDGKFATAVKHYTQARDLAREHNLAEHRTAAEDRISKTTSRVPRLAIAFTERLPNMKLLIDDQVIPTDEESTNELRLDPGARHIVVTAPGRLPFDTSVTLIEGKQSTVAIPKLGYPVTNVKKTRSTVGKVMTFSGVGVLISGVVLGFKANRDYEAQFKPMGSDPARCVEQSPIPLCDPDGYQATSNARQLGTVGTVIGAVGIAALGVGVVLWLTAPSDNAERDVALVPSLTTESAGLAAVGRF